MPELTAAEIAALRELEDRSAREGLSQWTLDNRHWLKKRHWEFIAALRNAAPRLLAEVERLTAENAELRERALLWERLHDGRTESLNRQYRLIKYAIEAPDADSCRTILLDALHGCTGANDVDRVREALRDAYPFGERRFHPYRIWCDAVRRALRRPRRGYKDNLELFEQGK